MKKQSIKRNVGFSLIEVMIVVAIIGILASIAIPSYRQYVVRSNRTEAMDLLNEIMGQQQRWVLRQRTFTDDLSDLGYADANNVPSDSGLYQVSAGPCDVGNLSRCVLLTAQAQGIQADAGDGDLTLNSRGEKTWNGNDGWYHRN